MAIQFGNSAADRMREVVALAGQTYPNVTNRVTGQTPFAKTVTPDVTQLEQQIVALKARIAELEAQTAPNPKSAAERMRDYRKRKKAV